MRYPALLPFVDVLAQLHEIDQIIDVRSPSEFAEDHIPGAVNYPVLTDQERVQVGTLYKQVNAFEAKKLGAALVAKNIAHHLETRLLDKPRDWKPLIYCWRGGNRSGAMAHIFAKIGWPVLQLDGGYKAYRHHVNADLAACPSDFRYRVLCGATGSGKSRLLKILASEGAQVLDLEKLAAHRGSVLGNLPAEPQPSQKMFESRIWDLLRSFDSTQIVFIESESKKIGSLRVPDLLMENMRSSACVALRMSHADRVKLLMEDYPHFVGNTTALNTQLACLASLHGKEKIQHWQEMALSGQTAELVAALLAEHYDPAYARSIERNFTMAAQAQLLDLGDISEAAFLNAARSLISL